MDSLLGKVAGAAGVKADAGEGAQQTMKEAALEKMIHDKVEGVAGKKVADSKQAKVAIEKVADAVGDKAPTGMLGAGILGSSGSDEKKGESGDVLGAAAGFLGK